MENKMQSDILKYQYGIELDFVLCATNLILNPHRANQDLVKV